VPSTQVENETEDDNMDQDTATDRMTMNQNLRQEPKMKTVRVNHPIIDSKASRTWNVAKEGDCFAM